jgi:two-component system sensor histidine kinase QseC
LNSIRSFLTYTLVFCIGIALFIAIIMSYQRITQETEELYDAELAQTSRVLEAVLAIELEYTGVEFSEKVIRDQKRILPPDVSSDEEYDTKGHKYERKLTFQVWNRKGAPLLGSGVNSSVLSFRPDEGYGQEQINEEEWRTFVLYSDKLAVWIKVAQQVEMRDDVIHGIATLNATVLSAFLPIIFILITLIVRKGLTPLNEINKQISLRDNSNLTPLNITRIPNELTLVVESVDRLMLSLDRALERQKRFTGNAAHELRTPLAAIKIHAQNLYPETARLQKIQDNIVLGVDKLTHLFNQLITLSQAECSPEQSKPEPIKLNDFIDDLMMDMQAGLTEKQISLQAKIQVDCQIYADKDTLRIMLRNIIDNAIKYIPEQGKIEIEAIQMDNEVSLRISDNGPGLTTEHTKHVFERFYRASSQDTFGCGIGLSIVKEICEKSNYRISLSESIIAKSGLTVIIDGL